MQLAESPSFVVLSLIKGVEGIHFFNSSEEMFAFISDQDDDSGFKVFGEMVPDCKCDDKPKKKAKKVAKKKTKRK